MQFPLVSSKVAVRCGLTKEGSRGRLRSTTFSFVTTCIMSVLIFDTYTACVAMSTCQTNLCLNTSTNAGLGTLYKICWREQILPSGHEYLQYSGQKNVLQNQCNSMIAVYLGSNVFLTLDGFHSDTNVLVIPTSVFKKSVPIVSSAVFLSKFVLLFVINNDLYSYHIQKQQYNRLPVTENVTIVNVADHCYGLYSIAAVATSQDQLLLLIDLESPNKVLISLTSNQEELVDFALVPTFSAVVVLVKENENSTSLRLVDLYGNDEINTSVTMQSFTGNVHFKAFDQPCGYLILWNSTGLYFSSNAGQSILPVTVTGLSSDAIRVHVVVPGNQGDYIVLTTDGVLIFGQHSHGLQIASNIEMSDDLVVKFNSDGNIQIIALDQESVFPSVKDVISTWDMLASNCQLQALEMSLQETELHYLDKSTSLNFTAMLLTQPWQDNQILVTVTQPELLTIESTVHANELLDAGILAKKLTVEMKNVITSAASSLHTKYVSVRINDVLSSMNCKPNPQLVAEIAIGCPPDRTVRVRNKPVKCDYVNDLEFMVNSFDTSTMVQYRTSEWGCPFQIYYADSLVPVVDLYDGDYFIEEVNADFVIFEEFNRSDVTYRLNAKAAGCVAAPQDWTSMIINSSNPRFSWTRENYETCFNTDRAVKFGPALPGQTYEIINSTNRNSLQWQHNGYYVYTLIVLDPNYSFCNLHTQFAVHVHGILPDTTIGLYTLPFTALGLCFSVVIAYLILEKCLKKNRDKVDEDN